VGNIEKYMTTKEVSQLLRVHQGTVQRWLREGTLVARKIGRKWLITESDLDKVVKEV